MTFKAVVAVLLLGAVACIDRLPDQDLRILAAQPAARLSADILWKDYQSNKSHADSLYFGKPIVISGLVTASGSTAPGDRFLFFGQPDKQGVRANLLDEQAADILTAIPADKRMTLKCYCEGLTENVVLKSCVRP